MRISAALHACGNLRPRMHALRREIASATNTAERRLYARFCVRIGPTLTAHIFASHLSGRCIPEESACLLSRSHENGEPHSYAALRFLSAQTAASWAIQLTA